MSRILQVKNLLAFSSLFWYYFPVILIQSQIQGGLRMRFQTIVAPTITELFERQIQGMILSGQVEPGEKLPTEAELAENMHISKSAVHAGIKNLERMGFLRVSPRHGVYVADWAECGNVDTLISILKYRDGKLDKATTASLLQTRNVIEGLAVRLFVPKRTDDDIAVLRTIIRDFRQGAQQPRAGGRRMNF